MLSGLLSLLLIGYLAGCGFLLEEALVVFFHFEKSWRTKLLGSFFAFSLISLVSGAIAVFVYFSPFTIALILTLVAILSLLLFLYARRNVFPEAFTEQKVLTLPEVPRKPLLYGVVGYLFLAGIGFYLLYSSRSGAAVSSPWQVINQNYIYLFALATFVLALLIVARLKSTWVLLLLMVHSMLLHGYLPLTHDLFYGADGWRHLATEQRIAAGLPAEQPVISDDNPSTKLTFTVGKLAYSQLWGVSVLINKLTQVDLMTLNKWLVPVVWSLFLPILLYEIGRSLGWGKRMSLVFVWLGFLPFAWQASGAFTLPVNLGFITWISLLLLIFKRAENPEPFQVWFLIAAGLLSVFGYSLFVLLFWMAFLIFELINWKEDFTWLTVGIMTLIVAAALPVIEWQFGYSEIVPKGTFVDGIKQFIGNFNAYYLAAGPRSHDILAGNVIFNETPSYAFVGNIFTSFRWWLVLFMLGFWFFVILGLKKVLAHGFGTCPTLSGNFKENSQRSHFCWFLVVACGLYLGYIVSRYWLPGEHLLTRRLDAVLAFLFIVLFMMGVNQLPRNKRFVPLVVVGFVILTAAISASYSLGPDTGTNSTDELSAMKYIWEEESKQTKHCVIADTYPLLALEALSDNKIIGGGFPISHNFEQPELSKIISKARIQDVSVLDARRGLSLTGASKCWILVPKGGDISYFIKSNGTSTTFGSVTVWKFPK